MSYSALCLNFLVVNMVNILLHRVYVFRTNDSVFVMTVQHAVKTSSSVTTQDAVSHHGGFVTVIMIVETRQMNRTAVSDYLLI